MAEDTVEPTDTAAQGGIIWILVDQSSREATYQTVADLLRERQGVEVHIVTINEVLSSVAREALSGGAERLLRGLRVAMRGRNQDEDLLGAVRRGRPDLLAITNPRWIRALGLLESLTGIASLQIGVFPDYNFDETWTKSGLHGFVVPHPSFRDRLSREGVEAERILVGGPAIGAPFARELDRAELRRGFGFGDEQVVLVRAETFEASLLDKIVFQATLVERDVRFVFHHNGDGTVASTLRRAASQYGLKAAMFGRVDDLERYVLTADAVLASPRDPFIPEILALDRPLLLLGPAHGASDQIEFLRGIGAARALADVLRLGSELERFLEPESLAELEQAAAELSRNEGSRQVADALLTALDNRVEWRVAPRTPETPPQPDDQPDDDKPQEDASPFETIGSEEPVRPSHGGGDGGDAGGGGGRGSSSDGEREPAYTGISKAEAKDQLAALILSERDIERKLADGEKQQQRWRSRLEMAREWGEADLAAEAEGILRGYLDEAEKLQAERASILRQKSKLKQAAGAGAEVDSPSTSNLADIERRFRKMEVDNDLDDLKDRIRRETGD